jgi:GntR family mannosyl-D-glycerate transport/metabolism transcriptional repressor
LMPTKEMVSLLGVAADQPILQKISKGFLADGTVFEFSRNTFRTDDYKFTLIARRMPH